MVSHPTALIAPSDSNYTYQYKFTYKETLLIPILWLNIDNILVMQVCETVNTSIGATTSILYFSRNNYEFKDF